MRSPQLRFKGSRRLGALIGLYNLLRVQLGLCTSDVERAAASLWIAPPTYVSSQKMPVERFGGRPAFSCECECNRPVANGKRLHRRAGASNFFAKTEIHAMDYSSPDWGGPKPSGRDARRRSSGHAPATAWRGF